MERYERVGRERGGEPRKRPRVRLEAVNLGARIERSVSLSRRADVRTDVEDHPRFRVHELARREIRIERPLATSAEAAQR